MKKSRGLRKRSRSLLKKKARERGKTGLSSMLRQYEAGDRVLVRLDSSIHKGMPHTRFHGKVGIVEGRRGDSYIVMMTQGKATKQIIARPEHLEPFRG
ncbi:MAG: 50S ribosomal protein L21e [Candidatus Bathyarchaeota archaeon]|nr:MAG: 50S ribosomal protein L21e [Candidatus Bathyarchaeota archaeon]